MIKIFITGCAKSGTTLLQRLFYAFKDIDIILGETSVSDFTEISIDFKIIVAKRSWDSIFSYHLSKDSLEAQKKLIVDNDIHILNIIRDGRDVILSDNKWVKPIRWISCMGQRIAYKKIIDLEIKYENLIYYANSVQDEIKQTFGLNSMHNFSDCPNFIPDKAFPKTNAANIYAKRGLDSSSIGKDLNAYTNICTKKELRKFEKELSKAGYY